MIPRIIHQTWRDAAIPESLQAYAATWRRHHPDWEHRLWTDADLAELVDTRFPELAAIFHGYPRPVMRADLGRYLVLRTFGGIYADLDAEALRPWDLMARTRPVLAEEPASHAAFEFVRARGFERLVSNAVIASPPEHGFWDHFIALIKRCRHAANPLDATGPFVLTAAVDSAESGLRPDVLPPYMTSPIDKLGAPSPRPEGAAAEPLARHHWHGTWWSGPSSWPEGFDAPAETGLRDGRWIDRLRERKAQRKLKDAIRAAKALAPSAPPPGDAIMIAIPVRDAAPTLDALFAALLKLDHPRARISLAFVEGDSADDSYARLRAFAAAHRKDYRRIAVLRRRFNVALEGPRWAPGVQRVRRANIARVRNCLLRRALRDEDWVLWLDADIVGFPPDLIAALLAAKAQVVAPHTVKTPGGLTFDTNAWATERALSEDAMRKYVLNGLYQPPLGYERLYLSDLRYRESAPLDSVGGAALLVDAALHRAGITFPETPYRFLIETEGFGAVLRDHGIGIVGLPNVEVIHADA